MRRVFRRPTVTKTTLAPTRASVRVTDFTSGESVTTRKVTSPTGKVTITRTVRGSGGRSVSPQRRQELIKAVKSIPSVKEIPTKPISPSVKKVVISPKVLARRKLRKLTTLEIRKKTGFFVLEKPKKKSILEKIVKERQRLRIKVERGQELTVKEEATRVVGIPTQKLIETGAGFVSLGKGAINIIRNPKNIVKVPGKTLESFKRVKEDIGTFGQTVRISPNEAVIIVGAEALLLVATGGVFRLVGKLSSKATTQLIKATPKFAKVKDGKIIVKSDVPSKKIVIDVSGKTVKKIGIPLKEQIKLGGRRITVVSAQADRIVNLLKTKRVIRKPIPNEAQLKTSTKKLLDKFDRGRINKKQLILLDQRIRIETGRQGSLLERSFFGSPSGKLRISRLGREPREATLLDVLAGDVTFKTLKPQILIFEKSKIEKLPKALGDIEKKIKAGKSLTRNEANRLLQFQLKKSSKFKPIGALSREPEVTLAPGEIVRKVKTIAFTEIRGKRIPIVRAEVIKPKPSTAKLLKKAREGKITPKEIRKLRSNLKRETGFKTSLSRRGRPKPRAKLPRAIPRIRPRAKTRLRIRVRPSPRIPPPKRVPRRGVPPRRISRKRVIVRILPRAPPRVSPRGRPGPRIPGIIGIRKRRRVKKKPTKPRAFNVFARPLKTRKGQKRPKLIRVNKVPLSKQRAEDLRNYIADTSLARTARIKPTRGKPRQPRLKVPASYSRKTSKKFRRFRIVKGKRRPLPRGKVIEKRTHLLDTRQEKRGITLRRRIKQISKKARRR